MCWHFFFFTGVDSFNICQPSFAKVGMWIIMADFLNKNIHIIFALFDYFYYYFSVLQPGCIDKFHKDTQSIIEHVAKDSAEKGLSEEAVNLFDLAKVHYCTVCRHVTSDFICKVKLQCTCNARTSFILLVSELNYSCQFKRHYTLMIIVLIISLIIKVSIGCQLICLEKLG